MQRLNKGLCVYYKYTTCFGTRRPASGVNSALFIYANILKAMAIGHFSYQPKLRVTIVIDMNKSMLKISINYFKMSKMYGSLSQKYVKI
jgi:hypothetical protein